MEVIKRLSPTRGGLGLIFAPHVSSPPHLLLDIVKRVLETGVNGLMFSEQFTGGAVRAVGDLTANYAAPPVLYGHNSGISTRTNQVWREVLDFMARLGIDFQTAPLTSSEPLLRPQGLEWHKCEEALTKPAEHIKPVMIAQGGSAVPTARRSKWSLAADLAAKEVPLARRVGLGLSAVAGRRRHRSSSKGSASRYSAR